MSAQSSQRTVAPRHSEALRREFEAERRETFQKRNRFDRETAVVLGQRPDLSIHSSAMVEMALGHAAENLRKSQLTESALDDLFAARRAERAHKS